jgi:hypothetical protein
MVDSLNDAFRDRPASAWTAVGLLIIHLGESLLESLNR